MKTEWSVIIHHYAASGIHKIASNWTNDSIIEPLTTFIKHINGIVFSNPFHQSHRSLRIRGDWATTPVRILYPERGLDVCSSEEEQFKVWEKCCGVVHTLIISCQKLTGSALQVGKCDLSSHSRWSTCFRKCWEIYDESCEVLSMIFQHSIIEMASQTGGFPSWVWEYFELLTDPF